MTGAATDLRIERAGTTTRLVLARPAKANALAPTLVEALLDAMAVAAIDGTRLLVLRGDGRHFCAGFDFTDVESCPRAELLWRMVRVEQVLQAIAHAPFATLAFAHGRTFGAGADLFVACETRVMAPDATFRMPGLRFGLQLGTRRLEERIGGSRARELLSASMTVDAPWCERTGFATAVAAPEQWDAIEARANADAVALEPEVRARLNRATLRDTRDADMADLVATAAHPDLLERIRRYRQGA